MSSRFSYNSSFTKLIIVVEFILVAYLLYSLTLNVYRSYQVDKTIDIFEQENDQLEKENKQKTEDYLYFTSEEYIDKIAKQNLGLVNPGEEVVVVSPDVLVEEESEEATEAEGFARIAEMSNPRKWLEFFFGR